MQKNPFGEKLKYVDVPFSTTNIPANSAQLFLRPQGKQYYACVLYENEGYNVFVVSQPYFRYTNNNWTVTIFNTHSSDLSISGTLRWYYCED